MRALVVDDSAVMRKVMNGVLGQCGIKDVVQAADGQQAVDLAEHTDFELVMVEWDLPGMSGLDTVRTLRARGKVMPIIMVAGEADQRRVLDALKSGATNFLIKPFDPPTVVAKVKGTLEKAGLGQDSAGPA